MVYCEKRGEERRPGGRREVGRTGGERGGEELQRADDSCRRLKLEPVEPQGQSGEEFLQKRAMQNIMA